MPHGACTRGIEISQPLHRGQHKKFACERLCPPAMPGEGVVLPTNGKMLTVTKPQSSLQKRLSRLLTQRVAKRVAGADEGSIMLAAPGADKQSQGPLQSHPKLICILNFYVAPKLCHPRLTRKRQRRKGLGNVEALSLMLGHPQVFTNMELCSTPAAQSAERAGLDCASPRHQPPAGLAPGGCVASIEIQSQWRQLSASETMLLLDQLRSPATIDKATMFGVRPPEPWLAQSWMLRFRWLA